MAASVNVEDLGLKPPQLDNIASQLAFHGQDVSTLSTMASDSPLSPDGQMVANLENSLTGEEEHVSPAQIEHLKVLVETLKRNLKNVENKLSEESALRLKADCALDEYKVREKSLLKVEQDGKALKEEVKWRNEQFESLQEAHNRMRDQFHEGQRIWASEKAAMFRNIEVLTENATQLERLQAVVNDVRECNTKAERRILLLEDRLRDAQRELEAKNNLSQSLLTVQEHEEVVLAMRSECEALQRQLSTCDAERFELEKERDKLLAESREKKQPHQRGKEELLSNAEVEGRKDRSSLPAGQRINTRRQLEDFAKQVKSLNTELQKWKDMATESNEGSSKLQTTLESVQKENEELRVQLNEWMQKASEHSDSIKNLEADVQKWKLNATNHSCENRLRIEELEHLRAEVEKRKHVAAAEEGKGNSARMKPLDSLGMVEDEMEVISSNPTGECDSERSLREEELDCSWLGSGHTSNELRHVASELETSLQAELEDWKERVVCTEKEQVDVRQHYEKTVKELHLEVETWKKSAACIAEDGRLERVELEKKLKEFQVNSREAADHVADERQRNALELAGLQAELQNWKARAADAAEECTSLRDAHENVIRELQLCKENAEAATEKAKSVRAILEKEVQDLENQVHVWKQKAAEALEGVAKNQEYEDLIKALDLERVSVQLQLERALLEMEEKAAVAASDSQALKDELDSAIAEKNAEIHQLCSEITGLKSELSELKGKAADIHSSLTETQMELQGMKEKIAVFTSSTDSLKDELSSANELANALTTQLSTQKQYVSSLQKLNRQLEADLELVREEALSRKEWMTKILTQLEGTVSMSQKELQYKLQFAQHRLLGNESVNSGVGEEAAAKAFPVGMDSTHDVVNCNSSPETAAPFSSHHQSFKNESPDFKSDIFRGSFMNPAVDQLQQELSSLNSFVSKLEHVRSSDGEQSQAPSVVGGGEKMRDVLLRKQVECSRATKEFVQPQGNRIDSRNRSQVLAEVDGNSLRVPPSHDKLQPEAPCLPVAPDNILFTRLRGTASGV